MIIPKVSLGIILYKAEKYLPYLVKSLLDQDYKNLELLLIDQSPQHEAYEYIKIHLPNAFARLKIQKGKNRMHSGGHNDLINQMTGEYYICASNDAWYPNDFVSSIVQSMESKDTQEFGFATVKIMRWDFGQISNIKLQISKESTFRASRYPDRAPACNGSGIENIVATQKPETLQAGGLRHTCSLSDTPCLSSFTNIIDSCGIGVTQSHQFYDRGQGSEDTGQYDEKKSIFGASGALAIFRKSALDSIVYVNEQGKKEYFDEMLHYKNDIDLSYRLQWAGQKCLFLPSICIYHDRQVSLKGSGFLKSLFARSDKLQWVKENSYFGHQVLLLKNFSPDFSWKVRLKTGVFSMMTWLFILIFEPFLLYQKKKIQQLFPQIMLKKSSMQKRIQAQEIEKFME